MTDQSNPDKEAHEIAMLQAIAKAVREGRVLTFYDADADDLKLFKPGVTVANPNDTRRN